MTKTSHIDSPSNRVNTEIACCSFTRRCRQGKQQEKPDTLVTILTKKKKKKSLLFTLTFSHHPPRIES